MYSPRQPGSSSGGGNNMYRMYVGMQEGLSLRRGTRTSGSCTGQCHSYRTDCCSLLVPYLGVTRVLGSKTTPGCLFCLRMNETGELLAFTNGLEDITLNSLTDHSEIVTSLVWFNASEDPQDESTFCTSSLDKTIKLWRDFKVVATYKEHNDWLRCLGLSSSNKTLICVSSVIRGWDVATSKPLFSIPNAHVSPALPELNTINSLQFSHSSEFVFISGARDGIIKIWDTRCLPKPSHSFQAHNAKLNTLSLSMDDSRILSSGRDSYIRLWDMRAVSVSSEVIPQRDAGGLLMDYHQHTCTGYNAASCFFNNEQYVITGSEDKKVYIYDTNSGETAKVLEVVHLVNCSDKETMSLVSSSIDNCAVLVWEPLKTEQPATVSEPEFTEQELQKIKHRSAIEALMKKYGDHILKIFHKFNFTFSTPLDWQTLLQDVRSDSQSTDLLQIITAMEADFANALGYQRSETVEVSNSEDEQKEESDDDDTDSVL